MYYRRKFILRVSLAIAVILLLLFVKTDASRQNISLTLSFHNKIPGMAASYRQWKQKNARQNRSASGKPLTIKQRLVRDAQNIRLHSAKSYRSKKASVEKKLAHLF